MMNEILKLAVCPECQVEIIEKTCPQCGRAFNVDENGIVNLLPKEMDEWIKIEAEFHDQEAKDYDKINCLETPRNVRLHRQFLQWIYENSKIKNLSADRQDQKCYILEIGGGTGRDAGKIAGADSENVHVTLSDLSKEALKVGFKNNSGIKNIDYCQIDAENLSFQDNTFGCIYIVAALHHLQDPQKFLNEAHRCLKEDGEIIIGVEPNRYGHVLYQKIIFRLWNFLKPKKCNCEKPVLKSIGDEKTEGFSRGELKAMLKKAGFSEIKIQPKWFLTGFYHTFAQKLRWLDQPWIDYILMPFDFVFERIPILNNFCWHWNARSQKSIKLKSL